MDGRDDATAGPIHPSRPGFAGHLRMTGLKPRSRLFRSRCYSNAMHDRSNLTARIDYDDLRGWLTRAELLGEVRHVQGASWQEDIGLAAEAILRAEDGPCVVFDDVPGCPHGFRLL